MKPGVPTFLLSMLFLAGLPFSLAAQNLTGIWRGYFNTYSGDDYKFEIQIEQTKSNRISGVSYSYLDTRFYGKAALTGSFNKAGKAALIQEIKTVEVKMAGGSFACIMKCSFVYSRSGNEEFLDGTYTSTFEKSDPVMGIKRGEDCGGGTVHLRRVVTSDFYVEPFLRKKEEPKKTEPVIKKAPEKAPPKIIKKPVSTTPQKTTKPATTIPNKDSVIKKEPQIIEKPIKEIPRISVPAITRSRENELVKTYTVNEDEIIIRLYDNGEIDDDTISVYLDGKPLVTNQRLSTVPITLTIKMSEDNPEHTLVMVAENLGRIPPNTSLMIVQDGNNRYTVSITSTEQKNAMVRFRYQKKGQ